MQNSFDEYGIPTQTSDLGDVSRSDDNSCTRHEYTRNTSDWLLAKVKRTEKVAVDCATTRPGRPTWCPTPGCTTTARPPSVKPRRRVTSPRSRS
ncbi:hypothetical protein NKG94_16825 [Micromonospora sp. M12]